jgi:hypothetical protein
MDIYLEIRSPHMIKSYEGTLKKMQKFQDHTLFVIRQSNGKGAIVDVLNEDIRECIILPADAVAA